MSSYEQAGPPVFIPQPCHLPFATDAARCVLAAMLPLGIVLATMRPAYVYWRGVSASAEAGSDILRRCGLSYSCEILAVRMKVDKMNFRFSPTHERAATLPPNTQPASGSL